MPVVCVVGARPNFMKMGPVVHELARRGIDHRLIHTGQHYDEDLSEVFFRELDLPRPDVDLEIGSDSHARQTARILIAFEEVCSRFAPRLVMVAGDVNSTVAAALAAVKLGIPVAHVEAGLRSFDRAMPEEINRVVTDHLSSLLFTTEASGEANLRREGIAADRVHFVGNCMVDTLRRHAEAAVAETPWEDFGLAPGGYALLTLHRPANVDDPAVLGSLLAVVGRIAERLPVVFPVHPRTADRLAAAGAAPPPAVRRCPPLPYRAFVGLMARARCVLTDSGGIQEETTALGVPCLTLRDNTERPVTVEQGTNRLVGTAPERIAAAVDDVLAGRWPAGRLPERWDGRAAERIGEVIERWSAER